MTHIEAMKRWLEALEAMQAYAAAEKKGLRICDEAITSLRQAIEQAQQAEPVAVWELQESGWDTIADGEWMETLPIGTKLYTTPPQRNPLTDEEIEKLREANAEGRGRGFSFNFKGFARAIEAKLKENT